MIKLRPISSPSTDQILYTVNRITDLNIAYNGLSGDKCGWEVGGQLKLQVDDESIGILKTALKHQTHKRFLEHLHYTFVINKKDVSDVSRFAEELIKADGINFKRTFHEEETVISVDGVSLIILKKILKSVGIKIKLLDKKSFKGNKK